MGFFLRSAEQPKLSGGSETLDTATPSPALTRRQFTFGLGASIATMSAMGAVGAEKWPSAAVAAPVSETTTEGMIEALPAMGQFVTRVEGLTKQFEMQHAVVVVDASGAPLGTVPVGLIDGVSPGHGYDNTTHTIRGGFASDWIAAVKAQVVRNYPALTPEDVFVRTNWYELQNAVDQKDEDMTYDNTASILDITHYFGDKPVRGAEDRTRIEYVRDAIEFHGNLAKVEGITDTLRRLIPGLCAAESNFNDDLTSSVGARGIAQIKPWVWQKELHRSKFQKGVPVPLMDQISAMGEIFSNTYNRIIYWAYEGEHYQGQNYLEIIKTAFSSQTEFEQYFMVPCMINAYNAGDETIGELIKAYAQSVAFRDRQKHQAVGSFDVFAEMTEFGIASKDNALHNYDTEAGGYVPKVYAYARLLDQKGETLLYPFGEGAGLAVAELQQQ